MDDHARVAELLGRTPQGAFDVVVRNDAGDPLVVRNAPFLDDGTPMPTRYYLVGAELVRAVSRLEADGGVKAAEAAIEPDDIAATHLRYAAERDAAIAADHVGPRPSGGVGGTRIGVKCLHAHVAYTLAGGDDPVGRWALDRLDAARQPDAHPDLDAARQPDAHPDLDAHPDPAPDPRPGRTAPTTPASESADAGTLRVAIGDRVLTVAMAGGGAHALPIGPLTLVDGPLGDTDPPLAMDLTNALGLVQDHLDDVIIAEPAVATPERVEATGIHAEMLARVELGTDGVPDGYVLRREDADEVFRTLALEPLEERRHNPGLDAAHAESIIGTCCVILGIMRRLDLRGISITATPARTGGEA